MIFKIIVKFIAIELKFRQLAIYYYVRTLYNNNWILLTLCWQMASNRSYSICTGGVNPEQVNDVLSGIYSALLSMIG